MKKDSLDIKERVLDQLQDKIYVIYSHTWKEWYYGGGGIVAFQLTQKELAEEFIKIRAMISPVNLELKKVKSDFPNIKFFSEDSLTHHSYRAKYDCLFE